MTARITGAGTAARPLAWPDDPEGLTAADIDFEALAHVLANTCRRGGCCRQYHSVAAHAVIVSEEIEALDGLGDEDRRTLALHALLANAPSAWLRGRLPDSQRAAERAGKLATGIETAVREAAGLDAILDEDHGELLRLCAVKTKKERKHDVTQWLGHADDRPVAETPPRSAKGAGRKGVAKFRRFPAAGRNSCDLNWTGREPSLAGRATTGPMASDMRSMCRKPLYLQLDPQWPDGAEGSRTEPDGLSVAFWWVRQSHSDTGQPFYPVSPSRKG